MGQINRRRFLSTTASTVVLGATTTVRGATIRGEKPAAASALPGCPPAPPIVELGKTGIRMSRLGQGTGVHGANRTLDPAGMRSSMPVDLMRHAYDRGLRFFDLADLYGTHVYFREALRGMDRSQLAILTKLWWRYDGPEEQTTLPERRQRARTALERFRQELATDPDIVLLHCLQKPNWDEQMGPYMDVLNDEKAKGRIRAVGCSCLDLGAIETAARNPWVDVILAQINVVGGQEAMLLGTREQVESVLRTARENGKAIIGMKIFGAGRLADQREACMKYAQANGLLDALTIGFHTPEQIDDVLHLMHKYPAAAVV